MNTCKFCKSPIQESFYFCPNCGKKIKEPPFKFSYGKVIGLLLESIFLPPLGLIPGIRYLRNSDQTAKILGAVAIAVTLISLVVSSILFMNYLNKVNQNVQDLYRYQGVMNNPSGSVQDQINQLQGLQ